MDSMNKDDAIQLHYMLKAIEQLEHYISGHRG